MENTKFKSKLRKVEDLGLKIILFLLFILVGTLLIAQNRACSAGGRVANDLEIFTESGESFTLYVNGQKINEEAASYVKITNIHHNMVHARIELEDKNKSVIKRDALMIAIPGTGTESAPIAAVFMIKKRLSFFKKRRYKVRATTRSLKKIRQGPGFVLHN